MSGESLLGPIGADPNETVLINLERFATCESPAVPPSSPRYFVED
jgi:hypothetical protein